MPHMRSVPPGPQLVDFRLDVKELNALHRAIDQAGDAIKKSEAPYVLVEEEHQRGPGQPQEMPPQPSATLRLSPPKAGMNVLVVFIAGAIEPDTRLPIRVLIMLFVATRHGLDDVMAERIDESARCST